ncbi:MAG: SRPBCC family protein [Phycisphaerales bacterium]|nr:SRPBCC family protein [Phycisphaerales bacterium]
MPGFTRTVIIARPPEEVFAFATNPARLCLWLPAIVRIEVLTPGPLARGTHLKETRRFGSREASTTIEIIEHAAPAPGRAPPYRHAGRSISAGVEGIYRYTFSSQAGGTRVDLVAEVRGRHVLACLVARLMRRAMIRLDGRQLDALKHAVESVPPAPQPLPL